jgi:hypothetical protein
VNGRPLIDPTKWRDRFEPAVKFRSTLVPAPEQASHHCVDARGEAHVDEGEYNCLAVLEQECVNVCILSDRPSASRNQARHLLAGSPSRESFLPNFLVKSGQNSFNTLLAISTPICKPSFDPASLAVRLFA